MAAKKRRKVAKKLPLPEFIRRRGVPPKGHPRRPEYERTPAFKRRSIAAKKAAKTRKRREEELARREAARRRTIKRKREEKRIEKLEKQVEKLKKEQAYLRAARKKLASILPTLEATTAGEVAMKRETWFAMRDELIHRYGREGFILLVREVLARAENVPEWFLKFYR